MGNDINGRTFTLQDLFDSCSYDIDYYQREFAWSAEDVQVLVDDLCEQFEQARKDPRTRRGIHRSEPYFLGPFVYYEECRNVRFLVDGQQRFTTVHLIFLHLLRQAQALDQKDTIAKLDRVIRYPQGGGWRFRIDIAERRAALQTWYDGGDFKPGLGASLSLRNLCLRSDEIGQLLDSRLEAQHLSAFVDWLLSRVLLVGIEAPSRDSGFRIFESMNDRGARLTPVDLLKSFLLSQVNQDEEELNQRWRDMLAELTSAREDPTAPSKFLKAALIAHHAQIDDHTDPDEINAGLHLWVRRHARDRLELREPTQFFAFVEKLIRLATVHRTFLVATREPDHHHGLAALYYNEINGLSNQMAFVLAAVRPTDTPSAAKDKAALIANFIDRWYVLRVLTDESALPRDLNVLMPRLLPQLRRCKTASDVATFLAAEMPEDGGFEAIRSFQLRGNNLAQVRYVLARLTAFVQAGWGEPNLVAEYLSKDRPWQIEHIFAKQPGRHPEITDPVEFQLLRNRLGVLVLLKASVNASLQDMTVARKIEVYRGENLLARCLHPTFRQNNKPIRLFMEKHGLQAYMRPFGTRDGLREAVLLREELYRRLCVAVWNPETLGFPAPPPPSAPDSPAVDAPLTVPVATPNSRLTDVQRMVRAGIIAADTRVVGVSGGVETWAAIQADGLLRLTTGDVFRKVDDAGRAVTGKRCEGMQFWHLVRPDGSRVSLRQLRNETRSAQAR